MSKTQIAALTSFFAFVILSIIFDSWNNRTAHLNEYAQAIEGNLHELEEEVSVLFEQKDLIYQNVFKPTGEKEEDQLTVLTTLQSLAERPFGIYFYQNDSLIFWTRSNVTPGDLKDVYNQIERNGTNLIRLSNGYYEFLESESETENFKSIALIPIKNEFRLESSYLENWFIASSYIPWQVGISYEKSEHIVQTAEGKALFYLNADQPFKDAPQQKWILFFYIMAAISMAFLVNNVAQSIVQKYRPWWGAAFLILSVVILRLLSFSLDFSDKFDNLAIFARAFKTPVLSYFLGDLLIDILLLLWLMVFFHREFKVKQLINISTPWQFLLTTLNYFSIILGILMVTSVFKSLVLDSGITFDFNNVFQLSIYSVLAIFGVIFLLFALFLFSHRMMLTIQKTGLKHKYRLVSQVVALLVALPVMYFTDLSLPIFRLAMGASLYILLFDLYIEIKNPSIIWLGIWLLFFSCFSSILLFKYNEDKDLNRRHEYAQALSKRNDKDAESELQKFSNTLAENREVQRLLFTKTESGSPNIEVLTKRINNIYSNFKYLFNIYSFEPTFSEKASIFSTDFPKIESSTFLEKSVIPFFQYQKIDTPNVFYYIEPGKNYSYAIAAEFENPNDSTEVATVYIKSQKKLRKASRVYSELILNQNFKNLENLDLYEYAVYKDDQLVEMTGGGYEDVPTEYLLNYSAKNPINEILHNDRSEVVYQSDDGTTVVIGRPIQNLLKPISLFSYLFVLLGVTVVLMALLNTFTRLLPQVLQLNFWRKPSLKNKIQLAVILTIIGSFVMIGWVTVIYFRDNSDRYHEKRLERKKESVMRDAEHAIQLKLDDDKDKKIDMEKLFTAISNIHRMDINVYYPNGDLMISTEPDIFNKGIISPKMGSVSFHALARQYRSDNIQPEKIGKLEYKAAYEPLRVPGGKIMGYIGLPYYAKQRNLKDDVYEFMGTLLNVYVFLLLIASTIAIFVANSITKPISVIGDRFRRFKLGSPEPLKWDSKDELGELIKDYNRMLEKVEASTEIIKKSEREGAWRTMAQQVAHEIKNPLTPMKLSIQYLQHAIKRDPDNVQELFERVGKTLMEQIENLVQIATAFSNFAQMPKPDNRPMIVNELVDSVYLLNVENQAVDFSMFLPKEPLTTIADKNQIRRVLNNVVSNAIQAIPEDRRGQVDISLFEKDNKAIIKISDNGKGISDDMLDKVFQPHFTTRTSGMGLGLAMCKDMVELAGGSLYFKTVVGKGTDFFIELPKIQVKPENI